MTRNRMTVIAIAALLGAGASSAVNAQSRALGGGLLGAGVGGALGGSSGAIAGAAVGAGAGLMRDRNEEQVNQASQSSRQRDDEMMRMQMERLELERQLLEAERRALEAERAAQQ